MDKVISARLDESVVGYIGLLAHKLKTSKKDIIESAVRLFAKKFDEDANTDVFAHTFGAWKRRESADATVRKARRAFQSGMERRQG